MVRRPRLRRFSDAQHGRRVGKSFAIKEQITGSYYYPDEQDGFSGHRSSTRRDQHDGAPSSEWVLLDGTPATCSNVALHNMCAAPR
jgi:broad specificity polyphosphatase/5'/3'-nucleotidase SurE